jgi:phosphoglycerol transferase MdoB-like AlkP superfamily enzyme
MEQEMNLNPTLGPTKGWDTLTRQLAKDSRLWIWIITLLFISRLVLITTNRNSFSSDLELTDYIKVFLTGFRFDMPVATILIFPNVIASCLCGLLSWEKFSNVLLGITFYTFTALWVIITTVTLGYFKQYHNQFDAHLLGVIHDDLGAIIQTVWQGFPVVRGILVMCLICAALIFIGQRWIKRRYPVHSPRRPQSVFSCIIFGFLILCMLTLGLRGSWGRRPMQAKDAARTSDFMLNRCVINPFTSLVYAIKAHQALMQANGLDSYLKKESILAAFKEYAGKENLSSVDDAFLRKAKGRPGAKPQHIFVVLMESYDGWTMLDQHSDWNISNEMISLGKEGIYVRRFLPASRSTMTSLASIICGMADAGIVTNERFKPGEPPYATAIAAQMRKLGYETHMYYAGYGGWQRIEDFCLEQGFEHTHMGSSMDDGSDTNEWGVSDKRLFSYIRENFKSDKPTFNLILTSSNHPPYSVDLEKENCPLTAAPLTYNQNFEKGNASLKMLGHHWYSDHYLGDFVRDIHAKHDGCLFVLTGDHWGRAFAGPRPTYFERAIVPLVLHGPGILPENIDASQISGSHYDLGATLIELAADPGHTYYALGRNLLDSKKSDIAISRLWLLGNDHIIPLADTSSAQTLEGVQSDIPDSLPETIRRYNLIHGISWWRIRKGNELPKN